MNNQIPFHHWLIERHAGEQTTVVLLAFSVLADAFYPTGCNDLECIEEYMRTWGAAPWAYRALEAAWDEYRRERSAQLVEEVA